MADTLLQMRTEVRDNVRRRVTVLSDLTIDKWINRTVRRIANVHNYNEMESLATPTTTADVKRYSHPVELKDIFGLTLQDGSSSLPLSFIFARYFDELFPRPETTSTRRPFLLVDYGKQYELYPIPDASYTINFRYWKYPTKLIADGDTSELLDKDLVIVAGATAYGFQSIREMVDSERWEAMFSKYKKEEEKANKKGKSWKMVARGFRSGGGRVLVDDGTDPFAGRRR